MESRPQYTPLFVTLGVVGCLGLGGYHLFAAAVDKLNEVNSDLGKAVVAGGVAVVVAVITLVIGKIWEQRIKTQQEVREKKVPVYEKQIETFFAVLFAQKAGTDSASQHELQKAFLGFTEKLIIWGSPEVIKAWSAFRLNDSQEAQSLFKKLETFIRAIRVDVGGSNSGLGENELMRLFVNDIPSGVPNR